MKTSDERGGDNHDDEMWGSDSDSDFVRKEKPQRSQHSRVLNSGRTAKTAPLYIAPALGRGKKFPFPSLAIVVVVVKLFCPKGGGDCGGGGGRGHNHFSLVPSVAQSALSFGLFVAAAPDSGCGSLFVGDAVQASERASRLRRAQGRGGG